MEKKLKIDPNNVEYDGRTFRLIIDDQESLIEWLKKKQIEIVKDLEQVRVLTEAMEQIESAEGFSGDTETAREALAKCAELSKPSEGE